MGILVTPSTTTLFSDECGITFRPVAGPPMPETGWLGIYFCSWAMQIGFRQPSGASSGGGHFGVQWAGSGATGWHSVLNFGMYDDIRGQDPPGYPNCVTRASIPQPPFTTDPLSPNLYFAYGDTVSFRVFRSPKQNWLAAELYYSACQSVEYQGNQVTSGGSLGNETAFRCMVRRNTEPWLFHSDVLMKNAHTGKAMNGFGCWTEYAIETNPGNPPYFSGPAEWPYNPCCDIRDPIWDGRNMEAPDWLVHYDDYGGPLGTDVRLITDGVGQWIRMIAGSGRTNPDGTLLTPGSTFWTAEQPNVTPNPGLDPSARVATPRPWY